MTPLALNRRDLLATAGAALGLSMLNDVARADNPAANVEDRGAKIKITALSGFRVAQKAFLKIETDAKITGWGEVTGLEPDVAIALAKSLFELLDGENPTRIEHLWQKLYRSHRDMRGGPFMTHVLSAIDMALWDITGKAWGVPVHRLLGGPTRDWIRLYPHDKAFKIGTGGPHPAAGDAKDVEALVKMVQDGRKKVGPDGSLMFDAHCAVPPALLIQFANSIDPKDVMFIEEPAVPGNIEVFKRIKAAIKIPLATGERDRTIWEFVPYLHERCVDILQPDCGHCGGITQLKKIATLAEAYNTPLAPHSIKSKLGLAASFAVCAAIPNFLIQEARHEILPDGVVIPSWQINKEGNATLPRGNGLGVEVVESEFEKVNADPRWKFKWPTPKARDGSVIDY
jgi:galactonate dehydratase